MKNERRSHSLSFETTPEPPLEEVVNGYINLCEEAQLYDVSKGLTIHTAWLKFKRLNGKDFAKAREKKVITPISYTQYGMPKYKRGDVIALLYGIDHFKIQDLRPEDIEKMKEVRAIYDQQMNIRRAQRAAVRKL